MATLDERIAALEDQIAKSEAAGVLSYRTADGRLVQRVPIKDLQDQLDRLKSQRDREASGGRTAAEYRR